MANIIKYLGQTYKLASKMFTPTGQIVEIRRSKLRTADRTGDRKVELVQYVDRGNDLTPAGRITLAPKLHAGVYEIFSSMDSGYYFSKQAMNTDSLLKFEDPIHTEILGEMDNFWKHKEKYEKKGFLHNRAVLMFGPPGSGKSCLIKLAVSDLINRGDVVFTGKNIYNLNGGLKTFREIEPERRCMAVLEDVDEMGEHQLLQLLDGTDTADNILYLATTNYVNRLPPRVLRPGRFDRKIEVPYPPAAGRRAYLESKLKDENIPPEKMNKLVKATEGFSFGHLREFVAGVFIIGQPMQTVLKRLRGDGLEHSQQTD